MPKVFITLLGGLFLLIIFGLFAANYSSADSWYTQYTRDPNAPPFYSRVVPAPKKRLSSAFQKKVEVRKILGDIALRVNENYSKATLEISRALFKKIVEDELVDVMDIDYEVFFDPRYNNGDITDLGIMVASVKVNYDDENGSISWVYNVVFEQNILPVIMVQTLNTKDDRL